MGKTRLALQVGAEMSDEFEDGVFFVDLATISEALWTTGAGSGPIEPKRSASS